MMNITINIQAPELAHAIETLAIAIGCSVDKIGVGEAIKEAVDQKPAKVTQKEEKVTQKAEKLTKDPEITPDQDMVESEDAIDDAELITIEQVRAAFVEKNSKANASKLKAILKQHKVAKVTDLPEETWEEVLQQLEAI